MQSCDKSHEQVTLDTKRRSRAIAQPHFDLFPREPSLALVLLLLLLSLDDEASFLDRPLHERVKHVVLTRRCRRRRRVHARVRLAAFPFFSSSPSEGEWG